MAHRAPNRDLVERYDGRTADGQVRRQYFRRFNKLERLKWILTAVIAGVALLWLFGGPLLKAVGLSGGSQYKYSHGPVAQVHAAWDSNCEACHKNPSGASGNPFAVRDRWLNLTCETCHAAPIHHATMVNQPAAGDNQYCADCHHDHQGRANSLVAMSDSHCTNCHAALGQHTAGGTSKFADKITNFASDHPEFKPLERKPTDRTIYFSHAAHMAKGASLSPKSAKKVGDLKDRKALFGQQGKADADLVELTCAACHQQDAGRTDDPKDDARWAVLLGGESKEAVRPPRAAGAVFLPINFELHCKACHPLDVQASIRNNNEVKQFTFSVPHHKKPGELDELVNGAVAAQLLNDAKSFDLPTAPFLRQNPTGKSADAARLKDTFTAAVSQTLQTATLGCGKCHTLTSDRKVAPVRIPTVWFTHAKFDHTAHRGMDCRECHKTAYADDATLAAIKTDSRDWEKEPVHIEGIASCKACHSPAATRTIEGRTVLAGGVRHGCVDCHKYHHGDQTLAGPGHPAQEPKPKLTTDQFLLGLPPTK